MVEDTVGAIVIGVRATDDADDREVLAVGTGDGVDDAEATHSEGDDAGTHASGASIAICGIASIELVAAADELEGLLCQQVVQQDQIEVAGHGENV